MKELLKKKAAELAKHQGEYKAYYESLEAKRTANETVDATELGKLDTMEVAGKAMVAEVTRLKGIVETDELLDAAGDERQAKDGGRQTQRQSKGAQFVTSEQFTDAIKAGRETTDAVQVKELYGAVGANGGLLVRPQVVPGVAEMGRRALSIRDLVNRAETNSSAIQFIKQSVRTNGAAVVPERNSGGTNFELKPESNLAFSEEETTVKTIAHWIRASRTILQDAPRLRDTIDTELEYMGDIVEENQIVRGSGVGTTNFLGIINSTGIQLRTHKSSGRNFDADDKIADTLRKAVTDIHLAFYVVDAIAISPQAAEGMELEKDNQGRYLNVFDPVRLTIWRRPVVESFALNAGEAIVGAFKLAATVWDRLQSEIRVSENVNDDFIRNALRILEERRLAFAVTRGDALEYVTGLDA